MKQDAVTLIEVSIVVIIIAILAAIAVPVYTNKIERTRGERAIANIELIKDALRMYVIKSAGEPSYPINGLADINTTLNLALSDANFSYEISAQGVVPNDYRWIEAARNGEFIRYATDPRDGIPIPGDPSLSVDNWDYTNSTWDWMP